MKSLEIKELAIHTIRSLSMDGVQKAKSGHPGTPMAMAPLAYTLYKDVMNHNPGNPDWFNRDRFVLSAGHASMLLYSILHLSGYNVTLDDLKNFRQLGSITPGHPEVGCCGGVETTTGPLGQGIANTVGMAIAEAHLAAIFNKEEFKLIDHYSYALCGDGDLMEGLSHEAAAIAGHLGLGKLMWFYDDNHITIEGKTDLAYSDDVQKRFEAYGWHVINLGEKANDTDALKNAIQTAKSETGKPSLVIIRSHIGYGAPTLQDTSTVHGAPLGEDEIKATKKFYGLPEDETFRVPEQVYEHMSDIQIKGKAKEKEWNDLFARYKKEYPELAEQFENAVSGTLASDWDSAIKAYKPEDGPQATRNIGGQVMNAIADKVPFLIGGSADLNPSTKTFIENSDYVAKNAYQNKNIAWGVRELGMCGATSGIALHGGLRPFASTFFVFSDYARPAIRLAAIMKVPAIYVMTHDSIGVGEDGPTHQPVEHMAALRCIPGLTVIRPADANETAWAWRAAIKNTDGPTMLLFTRQKLPVIDQAAYAPASGVLKGAYILCKEDGNTPDVILIATGSEVPLVLEAQKQLKSSNIDARVVSMPSWELFRQQNDSYRDEVLPPKIKARLAVEAGVSQGWSEWVGADGDVLSLNAFGKSGPYSKVFEHFGLTPDNIVKRAKALL